MKSARFHVFFGKKKAERALTNNEACIQNIDKVSFLAVFSGAGQKKSFNKRVIYFEFKSLKALVVFGNLAELVQV